MCRLTGTSCHCLHRDPLGAVSICERVVCGKGLLGRANSKHRGEGQSQELHRGKSVENTGPEGLRLGPDLGFGRMKSL